MSRGRSQAGISFGALRLSEVSVRPSRTNTLKKNHRPQVWQPGPRSFTDYQALWGSIPARRFRGDVHDEMVSEGTIPAVLVTRLRCPRLEILARRKDTALWEVEHRSFFPSNANPNQIYAEDYNAECRRRGQGEAGRRARNLLFSFLTKDQLADAEVNGYFDVNIPSPTHLRQLDYLERHRIKRQAVNFNAIKYRIERYRPTVWEMRHHPQGGWYYAYAICIHPATPHPLDDIALGQLIELQRHPNDFVSIGNFSLDGHLFRTGPGTTMWAVPTLGGDPADLELPPLSQETQTGLRLDRMARRMQETIEALSNVR